jgi:putative transposase
LVDKIAERLVELLNQKAKELQVEIVEANIMSDYVYLFIRTKPIYAPQFVVGQLKGYTSRLFASLRSRLPTLWTRSYYVDSVGKLNEYIIRKYIDAQKGK